MELSQREAPVVSYAPGLMTAFVGPYLTLLFASEVGLPLTRPIWAAVRDEPSLEGLQRFLKTLVADGEAIQSYAATVTSGEAPRVLLCASGVAELVVAGEVVGLICPEHVDSCIFELEDSVDEICLGIAELVGVRGPTLPFMLGVASARWLRVTFTESESEDPPETDAESPYKVDLSDVEAPGPPSPVVTTVVSQAFVEESGAGDTRLPDAIPAGPEYAYLFGNTVNRDVEEAAVRATSAADASADPPDDFILEVAGETRAQPPEEAIFEADVANPELDRDENLGAESVVITESLGIIDDVPFSVPSGRSAVVPTKASPRSTPDDAPSESTVRHADHAALLNQFGAPGSLAPRGPTVHALRCPAGHLNPPHLGVCRLCGVTIAEDRVEIVVRPPLGVLRLSTGNDVILDRSVLIGRDPSATRLIGEERPHLVKLASPGNDISREHLEVRLEGWHVLVVDLNATNGTVVSRPGVEPERLRPNDPAMIEPGTTVSIADEVTFVFIATA